MKNKNAFAGGMVGVILVIVVVLLILWMVPGNLFGITDSIIQPLNKSLGLEPDQDTKNRDGDVNKENQKLAEQTALKFKTFMSDCVLKNAKDRQCSCGSFDFAPLNDQTMDLTVSSSRSGLSLREGDFAHELPGGFVIGPIDPASTPKNIGEDKRYLQPLSIERTIKNLNVVGVAFSKKNMIFRMGREVPKSEGKMSQIYFSKPTAGSIVVDERQPYWTRTCGQNVDCVKKYSLYRPNMEKFPSVPQNMVLCETIAPDKCFDNNDQVLGNKDSYGVNSLCNEPITDIPIGCSIILDDTNNLISNTKSESLKESFEWNSQSSQYSEKLLKYKKIYDHENLFSEEETKNLRLIFDDLDEPHDIEGRVRFIDTIKPFDEKKSNGVSAFSNQIFRRISDDEVALITIGHEDKTVELSLGKDVTSKLKADKAFCDSVLQTFKSTNGDYIVRLEASFNEIKKRAEAQ